MEGLRPILEDQQEMYAELKNEYLHSYIYIGLVYIDRAFCSQAIFQAKIASLSSQGLHPGSVTQLF